MLCVVQVINEATRTEKGIYGVFATEEDAERWALHFVVEGDTWEIVDLKDPRLYNPAPPGGN